MEKLSSSPLPLEIAVFYLTTYGVISSTTSIKALFGSHSSSVVALLHLGFTVLDVLELFTVLMYVFDLHFLPCLFLLGSLVSLQCRVNFICKHHTGI